MQDSFSLIRAHLDWLKARAAPSRFTDALAKIEHQDITIDPTAEDLRPHSRNLPFLDRVPEIQVESLAHLNPLDQVLWSPVLFGPQAPKPLADAMYGAMLAYKELSKPDTQVSFGLFVLDRDTHYPAHSHPAEEVYLCLSGRVDIQYGLTSAPHHLPPGGFCLTPSNCIHSLTTGEAPVLLAYIWLGDNNAPNIWWRQSPKGDWLQESWIWSDTGLWQRTMSEQNGLNRRDSDF